MIVEGNATQTANLQEWRTGASDTVASVDNDGNFTLRRIELQDSSGTSTVTFGASTVLDTSYDVILPAAAPAAADYALVWDGSQFVWQDVSGAGTTPIFESVGIQNSTNGGTLTLYEDSDNGSSTVAIKAPDAMVGTSYTVTLPTSGPNTGESTVLLFDGSDDTYKWTKFQDVVDTHEFYISSYLESGTRVTGEAPDALGEYRSYLREANANTFTEVNGNPTDTPTDENGIRIYDGNAYTSADTNNEPTKYEIFVGINKNIEWQFYSSTSRTGFADLNIQADTTDFGYLKHYDPSTGIATIVGFRRSGGAVDHVSGYAGDSTAINDPYFDIVVR